MLLALLAATMVLAIATPAIRREPSEPAPRCPPAIGSDTFLAATLALGAPELPVLPGTATRPDELRPMAGEADAPACGRILGAIPDSLEPLGIFAPFHSTFYQAGSIYVAPVLPRITPEEMEAGSRGEWVPHKTGITFVFGPDLELLGSIEN